MCAESLAAQLQSATPRRTNKHARARAHACAHAARKAINLGANPQEGRLFLSFRQRTRCDLRAEVNGPLVGKNAGRRQDLLTIAQQFVQPALRGERQVFKTLWRASTTPDKSQREVRGGLSPRPRPTQEEGGGCCCESASMLADSWWVQFHLSVGLSLAEWGRDKKSMQLETRAACFI